ACFSIGWRLAEQSAYAKPCERGECSRMFVVTRRREKQRTQHAFACARVRETVMCRLCRFRTERRIDSFASLDHKWPPVGQLFLKRRMSAPGGKQALADHSA